MLRFYGYGQATTVYATNGEQTWEHAPYGGVQQTDTPEECLKRDAECQELTREQLAALNGSALESLEKAAG